MRPEEYIDENDIPTEEDFAPEHVDEKEQLRRSIKKGSRFYTVFYALLAVAFVINGIIQLDNVSESKLYLCPLIAIMLISAVAMAFYAIVYHRIGQASTAKEMQHYLNLMGSDVLFTKLIITTMTICIMVADVLGLIDKCPWYVIVLAALGIAVIIGGLCWLLKYSGKADPRDIDIERLMTLEDDDK